MAKASSVPHLRLVAPLAKEEQSAAPPMVGVVPAQLPLFLLPRPFFLGLVDMSDMRASPFVALLRELRPRWIMDLRVVPLLDLGGTNRRWFFELFKQLDIQYRDISGRLGIDTRQEANLSSGQAALAINNLLAYEPRTDDPGPLLVLLDDAEAVTLAARMLLPRLQPYPKQIYWLDIDSLKRNVPGQR